MGEVIVRQMIETDIKLLVKDFRQSDVHRNEEYFHFCFNEVQAGKRAIFVALLDDKFVGAGHFLYESKNLLFQKQKIPEINDLIVVPELRKHGIGRKLMVAMEGYALSKGYERIGLGVGLYKGYGIAQRLYIKRGYIPDGNGIFYNNEEVIPGSMVRVDDDLIIYLTKTLK